MMKELLTAAFAGMVKQLAQQLAINPRNLRVLVLLDDEEHTLARIDATTLRDLLRRRAVRRVLRFKLGHIAYDHDLGSTASSPAHTAPKRVKQRGHSHG